jgi:hypothetical protein
MAAGLGAAATGSSSSASTGVSEATLDAGQGGSRLLSIGIAGLVVGAALVREAIRRRRT